MAKKRVHEIAKELDIETKVLIKKLTDLGIEVKCNFSALADEEVAKVREAFAGTAPKTAVKKKTTRAKDKLLADGPGEAKPTFESVAGAAKAAVEAPASPADDKGEAAAGKRVHPAREADGKTVPKAEREPRADSLSKFGPGLVDKVPQRPPDRRFVERPLAFEKKTNRGIFSGITAPITQVEKKAPPLKPEPPVSTERPGVVSPAQQTGLRENGAPLPREPVKPAAPVGPPSRPFGKAPGPRVQAGKTEPRRDHWAGRQPAPQKQAPRPGMGAGAPARPARPGAPHPRPPGTGKGPHPGADRRPGRISPIAIPPPPQLEKGKAPQKQEARPKTDKRAKERVADRLVPQWEQEGEKLKSKITRRRKEFEHHALPRPVEKKPIQIGETITVKDLAEAMQRKAADLIKRLMMLGMLVTINQEIDADTAAILGHEFGYQVEVKPVFDVESLLAEEPETDPTKLKSRPPIVTVMGHVDHGKTSLLDAIRTTNVTATEAGGITQHIGAYQVEKNNRKITFIDTPGHEAFTAMRARGAQVTDVAVLVVAADDGVMPQTVEAINHARAAGVPIVVALNKIDKPNAKPDRVKRELADQGLVPEEWAGDTVCVPVSALKNQGIEDLLEMILLVADVLELKANPESHARGTVIESKLDKGRGPVATVLVQKGMLKVGHTLVTGSQFARVRAMIDDKGKRVSQAGPSTPVEVLGFSEVPEAGEPFVVIEEHLARQIVQKRVAKKREEEVRARAKMALEDVYERIREGQIKELPLIIKADVHGSAEALSKALEHLDTEEVRVNLIHTGVGAITETDIMLASAAGAIIIGFNVRPDVNARKAQEREKIDIRLYQVIYEAINDVKAALSGLLEPEYREVILGRAEVRKVFHASKLGTIAGCYVTEGKVGRDASVRVIHDGVVVHTGRIESLKRFKDDVREVAQGFECGLMVENYDDLHEGDELEFFTMEAVKRQLE